MATNAGDTFVEGSDTALASHTPTGTDAGTSWTQIGGGITVFQATDDARSTNTSNGNRANISPAMDGEDCDVQGDFSLEGSPGSIFLGCAVMARGTNASTGGLEFGYDLNAGTYYLGSDSTAEAWPGGVVTLKMECRGATCYGYANGVLKVTHTDTTYRSGTYAGILLLNFTGSNAERFICDNFMATGYSAGGGVVGPLTQGHLVGGGILTKGRLV